MDKNATPEDRHTDDNRLVWDQETVQMSLSVPAEEMARLVLMAVSLGMDWPGAVRTAMDGWVWKTAGSP
jgi:hypothetical protein